MRAGCRREFALYIICTLLRDCQYSPPGIPTRIDFHHQHDSPQDAAGHVKSALLGIERMFIVHEGKLLVGGSQGIYFLEFDGPRNREYYVKVIGDA